MSQCDFSEFGFSTNNGKNYILKTNFNTKLGRGGRKVVNPAIMTATMSSRIQNVSDIDILDDFLHENYLFYF